VSKEIKDNWFIVLGLDFYPEAEENEEKIKAKIEKKAEWERRKVRALNKEDFIRYINSYDIIKEEMLGDNNIRKELIEDAIAPVDNALKMGEGSIKVFTDDIIKKISRETKRSEKVVRQRIIENPILRLKSRFGVEADMQELYVNPSWGRPYKVSGYKAISRNKEIKQHLLQKIDVKYNGKSIGKRERAFAIILETFGIQEAIDWYNQKTMLVYEPFYWHSIFHYGNPTKNYICATSYNLGKYQQGIESKLWGAQGKYGDFQIALFTNDVYANCIKLEKGRSTYKNRDKYLGLYIPSKLNKYTAGWTGGGALMSNADMANESYGYGICMVWNTKKPTGIINTYDGSHSPGKPESTSKKKHTNGKSTIIKQYWEERTDQNGEIEYVNIGSETNIDYYREKTVKNIIITDEENLPTGNPQGYKLVGWFTGKDLDKSTDDENKANPTPGKELTARLKKAREKFRGKTNEETITLGEDKNTKKKYKGENSLVVVFLRKKAVEGIIDTYNGEDSPGSPEDPSNDKTKQGKKKILKQYWDIQNKQI